MDVCSVVNNGMTVTPSLFSCSAYMIFLIRIQLCGGVCGACDGCALVWYYCGIITTQMKSDLILIQYQYKY